jgi:hypothetical protein
MKIVDHLHSFGLVQINGCISYPSIIFKKSDSAIVHFFVPTGPIRSPIRIVGSSIAG